ncbi:hypothetical protein Btru_039670 [Bulinus truncatus]|nr:hypothetical protein Btru_039670 [Bulinus truncatus]
MDTRLRACATILFLACGQITSGQFIPYVTQKVASPSQDVGSILQLLFGKPQVLDKAGGPLTAAPTAPPTTTTTTKKVNSLNFLNPDGSVNRDRSGFISFYVSTPASGPADRQLLRTTTVNWLDLILRRSPQTQTVKSSGNQYRSYDQTPAPEVTTTSTTAKTNNRNEVLFVTNGGVFIVNNKKDATKSTPLAPTQNSNFNPSTKHQEVEVHDKPFTGVPESWFSDPHDVRKRAAHDKRTKSPHGTAQTKLSSATGSQGGKVKKSHRRNR